jgi:hypothetical protein
MPLFIGYRIPKSTLNQFYLGGVRMQAELVRTDNCATDFPQCASRNAILGPRSDVVTLTSGRLHFCCM